MKSMTLWEVYKYREGFIEAKSVKKEPKITEEEFDELMDLEIVDTGEVITAAQAAAISEQQKPR